MAEKSWIAYILCMKKQLTFEEAAFSVKKKTLRREVFLQEMNKALPWGKFLTRLKKDYKEGNQNGRPKYPAELMLRIYFLQQWFQLSDEAAEEALYDTTSMRTFAGISLGTDTIPDENTIKNFRYFLQEHNLAEEFFAIVQRHLQQAGLIMRKGTIVDATIINAPSSTKNESRERDPEMKQTKKGNQWYFGMKAHIGTDVSTGVVHTVTTTAANAHDSTEFDNLLHGKEKKVYGDKAYANQSKRKSFISRGIMWCISRKAPSGKELSEKDRAWNAKQSSVRAKGETPFLVIKHLWKYRKVRYRGIEKNTHQLFALFALANIFLMRKKLLAARR
jgi:IS5 family transposase